MVHRRWVPYCHSPLFSDLLHPEDGPSQGPHELPANPIHSSYGRLALGTAFTAGYKLPSARAITRSIAVQRHVISGRAGAKKKERKAGDHRAGRKRNDKKMTTENES